MSLKTCGMCSKSKPNDSENFGVNKRFADGLAMYCRECLRAYRNALYRKNVDRRTPEWKAKMSARRRAFHEKHKPEQQSLHRARQRKMRTLALEAYGPVCVCCGETAQHFLGIDHVNDDGNLHRRTPGEGGVGGNIYHWLAKHNYPKDGRFQVMCHNCNMAKAMYGSCPHKGPAPNRARHVWRKAASQ